MQRITALLTCHNRKALTLACLERLFGLRLPEGRALDVVLVDDGSSDGTGAAVRSQFPQVTVLEGDGSLYWCGGMRRAWDHAERSDPEFLLMVNDDTMLEPQALEALFRIAGGPEARVIAVGAVCDPDSGELTYGGRLRAEPGAPPALGTGPRECDTFNGNCALIPRTVRRELGPLHNAYRHSFADFDYGIQARRQGIAVMQSDEVVGSCRANSPERTWQDPGLSRGERLKKLRSPKGMPFGDHLAFARRTQGRRWLRHLAGPYVRILLGR